MRTFLRKRYLIGVAALVAALTISGVAFAYWTSTGSGSGTATTGNSTPFDVTVTPAAGNDALTPGGPTDDYTFTVTNNGSGHEQASSVQVSVANSDGSTWNPTDSSCSADDYAISGKSINAADLGPGDSTTGAFSIQMVDTNANQSGCEGANVPLYVVVS